MYHQALFDIVVNTGHSIGLLIKDMQAEDELFNSSLTLRAVEAQLLIMAHTMGNMPPPLHGQLMQADWGGWAALHFKLRNGIQPRQSEIWYAVNGLVPQTLSLMKGLRDKQPELFRSIY